MDKEEAIRIFMNYCEEFARNFLTNGAGEESPKEEECAEALASLRYGIHIVDRDYVLHPATKTEDKYVEIFVDLYLYELETELVIFCATITVQVKKNGAEYSAKFSEADKKFLKELGMKQEL